MSNNQFNRNTFNAMRETLNNMILENMGNLDHGIGGEGDWGKVSNSQLQNRMRDTKRHGFLGAKVPEEKQTKEYLAAKQELERRQAAKNAPPKAPEIPGVAFGTQNQVVKPAGTGLVSPTAKQRETSAAIARDAAPKTPLFAPEPAKPAKPAAEYTGPMSPNWDTNKFPAVAKQDAPKPAPSAPYKPNPNLIGDLQSRAYPGKPATPSPSQAAGAALDAASLIPGVGSAVSAARSATGKSPSEIRMDSAARGPREFGSMGRPRPGPEAAPATTTQVSQTSTASSTPTPRSEAPTSTPGSRPDKEMIDRVAARERELARRTREQTTNVAQASEGGMSQQTIDRLRTPQGPRAQITPGSTPGSRPDAEMMDRVAKRKAQLAARSAAQLAAANESIDRSTVLKEYFKDQITLKLLGM